MEQTLACEFCLNLVGIGAAVSQGRFSRNGITPGLINSAFRFRCRRLTAAGEAHQKPANVGKQPAAVGLVAAWRSQSLLVPSPLPEGCLRSRCIFQQYPRSITKEINEFAQRIAASLALIEEESKLRC